jgi:hypothetical protein
MKLRALRVLFGSCAVAGQRTTKDTKHTKGLPGLAAAAAQANFGVAPGKVW